MSSGVYQPRSRRAALSDAFEEAKRGVVNFCRQAAMRGAGGLLLLVVAIFFANKPAEESADVVTLTSAMWLLQTGRLVFP